MLEKPLHLCLEVIDQRRGQLILTSHSLSYPLTLSLERSSTFSTWRRRLHPALIGQKEHTETHVSQSLLRDAGTWLWQTLLPEDAPALERNALAQALRTGRTPLLLEIPQTLSDLPWELLCDPESQNEQGFLARRRPMMRLHPSKASTDVAGLSLPLPLRVLVLISSPPGLGEDSRLDVESERAAIELATRSAREEGALHLLVEDIVSVRRVQYALRRFQPHLVHYIGHGGYDTESGGTLLWEDERGNPLSLSQGRLAEILGPRNLHAVVLHACQTGRSDARTEVLGVAGTLVNEGIPAVLAQQANFTYESSQRASHAWYTTLTAGGGFTEALFEVRQALALADRPDWAVPILQGTSACLTPLLDDTALPGPPDPQLKSLGASVDLPTPTGVFVGRHAELRALRLMLENPPGSGPVIALITGPGGVGKSTLAAQAVTRSGEKYYAALTLSCQSYKGVDLFLLRIGELLKRLGAPGFLKQTLPDPKLSTEAKIEEAIAALNAVGPVLLVVDNLESVQAEDQTLRDASLLYLLQKLLTNLRGGRVLLTGRYAVKDLLPQGKFVAHLLRLDLADLSRYETNELMARHPSLARLGEMVRRKLIDEFGGLPYVYDLLGSDAASQSLDLLIHDVQGRITTARQQRSTEEWQSVRRQVVEFTALETIISLLAQPSRTLLAQLSVLQRSFPLAAIEQGVGAARMVWQPLLDRSLLRYDPLEQTYHLHNITKHFAEGLLDEQQRRQMQARLAAWYEDYAHRESHDLTDYLEAHQLWRSTGNLRQAGELVIKLDEDCRRFGFYSLLRDLWTTTLQDLGEREEDLTAHALDALGNMAYLQGDYEEALQFYGRSIGISGRLGNQHLRSITLNALGNIAFLQGDYKLARRIYRDSLKISKQLGNQHNQAISLHHLGNIAFLQGNYILAQSLYSQSLSTFELLGAQADRGMVLHQLGMIACSQGDYVEAKRRYEQSLSISEQLHYELGRATTLHALGNMAYLQGDYEEALQFYEQGLSISERLGDQRNQAKFLYQLGMISKDQGDFEQALMYTVQAYFLYGVLPSPDGELALRQIAEIRRQMDEATFAACWQNLTGSYPLIKSAEEESHQPLLQALSEFMKAPIREASKRFLEAHIELLQPEVDEYLQALITQEEREDVRQETEAYRLLLARCRDKGIEVAFTEHLEVQNSEMTLAARMYSMCDEVVTTLRTGNIEQQQVLATYLEQIQTYLKPIQKDDPSTADILDFLQVLVACLRKQDTQALEIKLQQPLRDKYIQMMAAVEQEEPKESNDDEVLTIEESFSVISSIILQGTTEQRQRLIALLTRACQDLPPEEAALGKFYECLIAVLRDETPDVASLEASYTEVWQEFQQMLNVTPNKER